MKKVVFITEKSSRGFHTLVASLNVEAELVFNDGRRYSVASGNGRSEMVDCLIVRARDKCRVLSYLTQAFNGISSTCGEAPDVRLFHALERMARSGHWKSMDEIEGWLTHRGITFSKQKLQK